MFESMYCVLDEDRIPRFLSRTIPNLKKNFAEYAGCEYNDVVFVVYDNKYPDILIGHFETNDSFQDEKVKMLVYSLPIDYYI